MELKTKIFIWLALSISLGIAVVVIHLRRSSRRVPLSQRGDNKLGKAMINMERASVFGDYPNFFEFAKYALREAMKLPRGKTGFGITIDEIIKHLADKQASDEIIATAREIYSISERIEGEEEFEGDLKEKLDQYYKIIREVNELFS